MNIIASAQAHDVAMPPSAVLPLYRPAPPQIAALPPQWPTQPDTQQMLPSSKGGGLLPGSPGGSGAMQRAPSLGGGSEQQAATDAAVMSHHAAAINASLTAAGSRLAGASSRASVASAQHQLGSHGLLSVGGASATASMHSARSGVSSSHGSGAGRGVSMSHCTWHAPQHPVAAPSTAGTEAVDEPLLRSDVKSVGGSLASGAAKVSNALDSSWQALKRYAGT